MTKLVLPFKWLWCFFRFCRELILNIFVFSLLIILFVAYNTINHKNTENKPSPLLIMNITGTIVDRPSKNNGLSQLRKQFLGGGLLDKSIENSAFDLADIISEAGADFTIKGLILKLDDFMGADLSTLQYIGKYLTAFKKTGKPIYAFSAAYNQSQYYLASFANNIYLAPQGNVSLYGMTAQNLYYKELLDKLDVSTHIFRAGTYKSAVEPLIRNDMSPEARENLNRWLTKMWQNYVTDVATNRQLTKEQLVPDVSLYLQQLKNNNGNFAQYAKENKLIDVIAPEYQFWQDMRTKFKLNNIELEKASFYNRKIDNNIPLNQANIAVVSVDGTIVDDMAVSRVASSRTITEQLRKIRHQTNIKAVILRVNSPGGSVTASEAIRSELEAIHKQGKKIIVSMGAMAASGGYWVSTISDKVIAAPNTITGSIGVFGIISTFENTLKRFGVYTDGISTSPLAEQTITKALSPEISQLLQSSIDNTYQHFLEIVAKARHKTPAQIDQVAQGQVWLGVEALDKGLVDQLGDFDDAVYMAADLSKLETFNVYWAGPEQGWFDNLFNSISVMLPPAITAWLPSVLAPASMLTKQVELWQHLNDPLNNYIYCLTCATVQ